MSPRSIWARIWTSEKGPKSSLSFWISQRSWPSSTALPATSATLNERPNVDRRSPSLVSGAAWAAKAAAARAAGASGGAACCAAAGCCCGALAATGTPPACSGGQRVVHLGRRLEPGPRVARQRLVDHGVQARGGVGDRLARRHERGGREPTCQHLVEDDAEREDVGRGHRRMARVHLGSHVNVVGRARWGAAPGQHRQRAGETEVGHLHAPGLVHPDRGGVQPPVGHERGGPFEPVRDVRDEVAGALERDRAPLGTPPVDEVAERLAVLQLGRDVEEI